MIEYFRPVSGGYGDTITLKVDGEEISIGQFDGRCFKNSAELQEKIHNLVCVPKSQRTRAWNNEISAAKDACERERESAILAYLKEKILNAKKSVLREAHPMTLSGHYSREYLAGTSLEYLKNQIRGE